MNALRASAFLLSLLVACSAAGPAPEVVSPEPSAERPTRVPIAEPKKPASPRGDDRFAIAAENATAVEAAREILEDGGSAVDAAIVTVLVGCAAHPASCGLGGGGAALFFDAQTKKTEYLDFREAAPSGIKNADYLSKNPPEKRRGVMVGVPGLVAGLAELHARGGKLPFATVVGAAADAVERGIPLSAYMAQVLEWNRKWLKADPRAAALWPADAEGRVGETLKNPALVKALRSIAAGGKDAFYSGALGTDVVTTARDAQSRVLMKDLKEYRVVSRAPLEVEWEGRKLVTAPPPSGAGLVVAELFHSFSAPDLKQLDAATGSYVHMIAEGLRAGYSDRALFVGDPEFFKTEISATLEPARLRARRAKFRPDATIMPKLSSISDAGTFHCVVVDADGDVVSLSASLSSMFGAKLVTESGFVLNDALSEFTIDEYGQRPVSRGPNFARGGARPVSNLVPTLVFEGGAPVVALGGSGGLRATSAVAIVLFAHLAFGVPLPDAIAKPRFHVTSAGALKLDAPLQGLKDDLVARGEVVEVGAPGFGAVTAIGLRREGGRRTLEPVFDPRRGGAITVGHDVPAQE